MKLLYLVLLACSELTFCTSHQPTTVAYSDPRFPECDGCSALENLYHFADTVFTRNDSLFIVNNRMDTTVVETGIFTYLQNSFPVSTPAELITSIRRGVQAEANGKPDLSMSYYREAISFYQADWLKRKAGFENGGFSDLNQYYAASVNVTILVSHAFEKLGRLPEARAALSPFLANTEAEDSAIQLRYIELCIQQYGEPATKKALDVSGKTVHRLSNAQPEDDRWRVNVFGANLGVADFMTDTLSPQQAQYIVQQQPYYAFVK